MNRIISLLCTIALLATTTSGCYRRRNTRKQTQKPPEKVEPAEPRPEQTLFPVPEPETYPKPQQTESKGIVSEIQETTTGMMGGAAFKAGQKMKKKINTINQQQKNRLDEELNK